MSKMKKKYLLEIEETEDGNFAWSNFAPYTEPDLQLVRDESYTAGYKAGREAESVRHPDMRHAKTEGFNIGYNQGLSDAWECIGKIANMSSEERRKIFGEIFIQKIQSIYSASEAIAKLKQYEQEKEEEISVGDEVRNVKSGWTAVVARISDDKCLTLMDGNGAIADGYEITRFTKTGRHFTEIIELLRKMNED